MHHASRSFRSVLFATAMLASACDVEQTQQQTCDDDVVTSGTSGSTSDAGGAGGESGGGGDGGSSASVTTGGDGGGSAGTGGGAGGSGGGTADCFCNCPSGVPMPVGQNDPAFCADLANMGEACCLWHGVTEIVIGACSADGVCFYSGPPGQ